MVAPKRLNFFKWPSITVLKMHFEKCWAMKTKIEAKPASQHEGNYESVSLPDPLWSPSLATTETSSEFLKPLSSGLTSRCHQSYIEHSEFVITSTKTNLIKVRVPKHLNIAYFEETAWDWASWRQGLQPRWTEIQAKRVMGGKRENCGPSTFAKNRGLCYFQDCPYSVLPWTQKRLFTELKLKHPK